MATGPLGGPCAVALPTTHGSVRVGRREWGPRCNVLCAVVPREDVRSGGEGHDVAHDAEGVADALEQVAVVEDDGEEPDDSGEGEGVTSRPQNAPTPPPRAPSPAPEFTLQQAPRPKRGDSPSVLARWTRIDPTCTIWTYFHHGTAWHWPSRAPHYLE